MTSPDEYLTVVFRCLSDAQRRQITEMREAVRLSWGDQLAERDRLRQALQTILEMQEAHP